MEWYYADESDQQISFQEENFKGLIEAGAIRPETLVWNSSMPDWKKASLVQPMLFGPAAVAAASAPAPPVGLPPAYGGGPAPQPVDGLGVAAMVCGILSILALCVLPGSGLIVGIPAIICGHMSRKNAMNDGAAVSGITTAGLVTGYIGSAINLLFGIVMLVIFIVAISADTTG